MRSPLSSPRFANITALLALVVATAGTSYAAVTLPKNSVGSKQLQKNSVVSKKVKDGSLQATDFAAGQLPKGEQGPAGAKGADGTALAYAYISADGTLNASRSKGITQANVLHNVGSPGTGRYCISGLPFTPKHAVATLDAQSGTALGPIVAVGFGDFNTCPIGTQIGVLTTRAADNFFVEQGFYLLVN
jgi:hypothetical protein